MGSVHLIAELNRLPLVDSQVALHVDELFGHLLGEGVAQGHVSPAPGRPVALWWRGGTAFFLLNFLLATLSTLVGKRVLTHILKLATLLNLLFDLYTFLQGIFSQRLTAR